MTTGTGSPRRPYRMEARAAKAAATRQRILQAAQARFLASHYEDVTLNAVATDAGVTRQTVLNVFDSKEHLFVEAARSLPVPRDRLRGPADRPRVVATLLEEHELVGDAVIRLLAVEDRIPAVGALMEENRAKHHRFLATVFADVLPSRGRARQRMLGEIHAALDVYVWKLLRRDLAFSVAETQAVFERFLAAALAGGGHDT